MTETISPASPQAVSRPLNLFARMAGVIVAPKATYTAVAERPYWFGVLAVVLLIIAITQGTFFSTEVGKEAFIDQQIKSREAFGQTVTDQAIRQIEELAERAAVWAVVPTVVLVPVFIAVFSGLYLMVFNAFLDGNASFKQMYAINAHSLTLFGVFQLFSTPIMYARGDLVSPTALSVFFPMLEEESFLTYLFGGLDLFYTWSFINLAIGLGALYKRRTTPIAVGLLTVYFLVVLAYASFRAF
jgi:hypothetical protein